VRELEAGLPAVVAAQLVGPEAEKAIDALSPIVYIIQYFN
jgi:hypothetical protein